MEIEGLNIASYKKNATTLRIKDDINYNNAFLKLILIHISVYVYLI